MSRLVSEADLTRQRQLRKERVKVADKLNVAIAWIGPDLKPLVPNPPRLPKPPREAA